MQLAILRVPGCKVTDEMLPRGAAAGKLSGQQVETWINAVVEKTYLIVKAEDPRLLQENNEGTDE